MPEIAGLRIEDQERGVILRQLTEADAEMQSRMVRANRDHISQFGNQSAEGFETIQTTSRRLYHEAASGQYRFGIFTPDAPDDLKGNVKMAISRNSPDRADQSGYWIAKQAVGKGLASAALGTLIDHAFTEMGVTEMNARVRHNNFASARVLNNNGFVLSALTYEHDGHPDYWQFYKYKQPAPAVQAMLDEPMRFTEQFHTPWEALSVLDVELNGMTKRGVFKGPTAFTVADGQAFAIVEEAPRFNPAFVGRTTYELGPTDRVVVPPFANVQFVGSAAMLMEHWPMTTAVAATAAMNQS